MVPTRRCSDRLARKAVPVVIPRSLACLLVLGVWLTLPVASAQIVPGDLLVAGADGLLNGHLKRIDATGKVTDFTRFVGAYPTALHMASDNQHVLSALSAAPYPLVQVAPDGSVTTLLTAGDHVHALDHDQFGHVVAVAGALNGRLLRLDTAQARVVTLHTTTDVLTAGHAELDSESMCLGRRTPLPAAVLRFDPRNRTIITLNANLGDVPVATTSDPHTGTALIVLSGPNGRLLSLSPGGTLRTLFAVPYARSVVPAQDTTLWVLAQQGSFSQVQRYDRAGRVLQTIPFLSLLGSTDLISYASRPLHGAGTGGTLTTFRLQVHVPGGHDCAYAMAASTGPRPPLSLTPNEHLYLKFDVLFLLSLYNLIPQFEQFMGVLDAQGHAEARVRIPPGYAGWRLYFSGVLFDPVTPGQVQRVFNTVGLTFQGP